MYRRVYDNARAPFYAAVAGDDFVGVQPYVRLVVGPKDYIAPSSTGERDIGGQDVSPDVVTAVIREVHANCRAPIMITENGIGARDDAQRGRHLVAAVEQVDACRRDGIPVLGYFYWTLIDNFEWSSGFVPKMGLYAMDDQTFRRIPKPAAAVYKTLVADKRRAARRV